MRRSAGGWTLRSVNDRPIGADSHNGGGAFALGQGWALPAASIAVFVALFYVPAHHAGGDGLVATIGGLYVVGLSVVAPRVARGAVLRHAGSREQIVLFGRVGDALTSVAVRPRWRSAAIATGAATSSLAALAGAVLSGFPDQGTYAHALASLTFWANVVFAAEALVPVPGFTGWALVLAIVDAAGTSKELRVRRAARLAHGIALPLFLALGMGAALLGDPILMLSGFSLAVLSWTRTDLAVGQDLIARFLARRVAGDVARPVMSHAEADQPVDEIVRDEDDARTVTVVETSGALVGAIGPRQFAARALRRPGQCCSELMVPIARVPLFPAATPAASLLPPLGRHGFVLVRVPDGLAYIEAADLLERIVGRDTGREPGGVSP